MQRSSGVEPTHPRASSKLRSLVFHPFVVLLLSVGGALLYAAWVTRCFGSQNLQSQYLYVVPIIVPFLSFLLDRSERFRRGSVAGLVIDFLVVGTSMMRVI